MKNSIVFRFSLLLTVLIGTSFSATAQSQQKFRKTYPVKNEVALTIDSRHTKLVFETWDKNELEVETFIDTRDLSDQEIAEAMAAWQVRIKGDQTAMYISSEGGRAWGGMPPLPGMDSLGAVTARMINPLMKNLVAPMVQSLNQNPLPPEFLESVGSIHFDHEAYQKEGEKYLEEWEKEIESKFGDNFEAAMEQWGKNFEKNSHQWSAQMEVDMEAWGEEFGKGMEQWAEQFGTQMEAWGEQFGKDMEQWARQQDQSGNGKRSASFTVTTILSANKVQKTMIIRMPKEATLSLQVRYGEVQLADRTNNLRANLAHSKLVGKNITGKNTRIEASYTPIKIKNWDYGILNTNYVKTCSIENAKSLKLSSVSSDVRIGRLEDTGIIAGTFANLELQELSKNFNTLDLSLENSDLKLNLPESPLRFNYTGSKSNIEYPSSIKANPVKNYDNERINGYQKSENGAQVVNITARFSDIVVE